MGTRVKKSELFIFIPLVGVYLITLNVKFNNPQDSFLNNYLADLLCMPIVLYLATFGIRFLTNRKEYQLSLFQIFVGFSYFALLFEIILPFYSIKYTRDFWDIVLYLIGSILFIGFQKMTSAKG